MLLPNRRDDFMKAQSAIEYLTVYGWALVALLVVLSALYLSGILKFQSALPRECVFQPGIKCVDYKLQHTPLGVPEFLWLRLTNNFGFKIKITGINARGADGETSDSSYIDVTDPPAATPPVTIENGDSRYILLEFDDPADYPYGAHQKFSVNVTYINCETTSDASACPDDGSGSKHVIYGRVYTVSEPPV